MPKRKGLEVVLIPLRLKEIPHRYREATFFGQLQTLNNRNDVERDGLAIFTIGPKQWKQLEALTQRSVQSMKRWLTWLARTGWATIDRLSKDTHRVTIYGEPVKNRKKDVHTKRSSPKT